MGNFAAQFTELDRLVVADSEPYCLRRRGWRCSGREPVRRRCLVAGGARGRRGSAAGSLVRLYDQVVIPATRAVERRIRAPLGQSVLCVAPRPAA